MKTWLKDYFIFNNNEHKSSIFLLCMLLIAILLPQFIYFYKPVNKNSEYYKIESALKDQSIDTESSNPAIELTYFNPNTASKEALLSLGLKPKTVDIILNFRNKKGVFRTKEDFKKMYTLEEGTYQKLEPFLIFDNPQNQFERNNTITKADNDTIHYTKFNFNPNTISADSLKLLGLLNAEINHLVNLRNKGVKFYNRDGFKISSWRLHKMEEIKPLLVFNTNNTVPISQQKEVVSTNLPTPRNAVGIIDINKADANMLKNINGIGDVYANKIIKNRDQLGGYHLLSQLSFVLPDSVLTKIKPYLEIKPNSHKRIKINKIDAATLTLHPLFKYKADMIMNYKSNHGNFKSIHDIWKIQGIKKDFIDRIEPYLDFDE